MKGLIIVGWLACSTVLAGWTNLNEGSLKTSVGDNKIAKVDDVVLFWQQVEIKKLDSPIDKFLLRVMASCGTKDYVVINQVSYKNGNEVYQDDKPTEVKTMKQGSLLGMALEHVCVGHEEVIY